MHVCLYVLDIYPSAFLASRFPKTTARRIHPIPHQFASVVLGRWRRGGDLPRATITRPAVELAALASSPWRFRAPTRQSRLGGERELLRGLALINPPTGRRQRMEKQQYFDKTRLPQKPTNLFYCSHLFLIYFADFFAFLIKTGCSPLTNLLCSKMSH